MFAIVEALKAPIRRRFRAARRSRLLSGLDLEGKGLEIGPSHTPLLPKRDGYDIEIIDHSSADRLRQIYKNNPLVDVSRIEEVDYVSGGRSIAETINKPGHYDYIVASHVIEHMPSLLGFLLDCETLLKPNGLLSLAVPDMRYCFDVFQSRSTTGDVLEASLAPPHRARAAAVFDYWANRAHRRRQPTWRRFSGGALHRVNAIADAKSQFDAYVASNDHVDCHVWRFVPSSFRLITKDLNELDLLQLRECEFHAPGGLEFFVKLSRAGPGVTESRDTLSLRALRELRSIRLRSMRSAANRG